MQSITRALAALLLALALGACSSNGGDDAAPTTEAADPTNTTTTDPDEVTTTTDPDDGTTTEGGSGGASEAGYVEALAVGLAAPGDESEVVVTRDEADCIAPAWIDIVTVDVLVDAEVAPVDLEDPDFDYTELGLSGDQGTAMIDATKQCDVDLAGQFSDFLAQDLDDTQAACLEGELNTDLVDRFLAQSLVVEDLPADLRAEFDAIALECGIEQ